MHLFAVIASKGKKLLRKEEKQSPSVMFTVIVGVSATNCTTLAFFGLPL
jgi:hypothetical protein